MDAQHDRVAIESAEELRTWLAEHQGTAGSVWLVLWKKGSGHPFVSYDEIVDESLCFGWIDSLPRKLDATRSLLRISPRNPRSHWSRANKERVARLTRAGRMQPAGLRAVELAKATGTWDFLDDVERLEVPDDLATAFERHPGSRRYFERFPPSSRRGILEWIRSARTDRTRVRRIEETASRAADNRKANHPRGRDAGPRDG